MAPNTDFGRDMLNIAVGIVWQTSLVAAPIFLVIRDWPACAVSTAIAAITTWLLKIYWWDRLVDYPADSPEEPQGNSPTTKAVGP